MSLAGCPIIFAKKKVMNGNCVLVIKNLMISQLKINNFYQVFKNYKIAFTEPKSS